MKNKFDPHTVSWLRITLFAGLILLLIIGGTLTGIVIKRGADISRSIERENAFHRLLREYDFKYSQIPADASDAVRRQSYERLDSDLDRLEKRTGGVESWLSVLKRRRQLASLDYRYEESYRQSAQMAQRSFPYSEPIIAVNAAALVHNTGISGEGELLLRNVLSLLTSSRYTPMRLSLHVLLGDFHNPETAAAVRHLTDFMNSAMPDNITEAILSDLIILKILAGDIPSAAIDIQSALDALSLSFDPPAGSGINLIRLAAEYFYDFGSPLRSAELFSMLPDEASLGRQADALWLAGYSDPARTLWSMQTGGAGLRERALYNLALSSPTDEEEAALFEQLIKLPPGGYPARCFGLIHFSRFFDVPEAVAILEAGKDSPDDALIDLEILKRRTEAGELARLFAETWLLLDRYPDVDYLYEWGAWYFNLQRNFAENAKLLQIANRHQFSGYWLDLYGALQNIRDGHFDTAEKILSAVSGQHWTAEANLGRVLEIRHAPAQALEHYEKAMALQMADGDDFSASRIQVRIAQCLKSLGKIDDCRRALNYALDLNPDNLSARLELSRL